MSCESCGTFRQQGHNFCGVCGDPIDAVAPEVQAAVADIDLRDWAEQGWTIKADKPCPKCEYLQTCSRIEIREEERGYDPGTTISCNPLFLLLLWLFNSVIKMFFPPRIVTMNIDRIVCPRCREEWYENLRVVSERRVR